MLNIIASYHRNQFQRKLIIQTQENGKKPQFEPDLGQIWAQNIFFLRILPLMDVKHCSKLSWYAISRKTYDPNSIKW